MSMDFTRVDGIVPPAAAAVGIRGYVAKPNGKADDRDEKPTWRQSAFSAASLRSKRFPDIKYIVPGLIPEGLSMLVGRPKVGKSWMALRHRADRGIRGKHVPWFAQR
jgi:AAA domain